MQIIRLQQHLSQKPLTLSLPRRAAYGTISPSGAVAVAEGTNQTFTITPNTGYQVSDVLVDDISVGLLSSYTFNNVLTDHTISAAYTTVPTYSITAVSGTGGSITPFRQPLWLIRVQIRPSQLLHNSGYRISNVLVDNNPVGAVSTYTLNNIVANHTISASFTPVPTYTIAASAGAGGAISPAGNISVTEGANRTFTITPNTGYYITNVLVDNASVGTGSAYTFSNVTSNHTISATFAQLDLQYHKQLRHRGYNKSMGNSDCQLRDQSYF